jgi:hypothetical protein
MEELIIGKNYLIFYPKDTNGRIEFISKYIGKTPNGEELMVEPMFMREYGHRHWSQNQRIFSMERFKKIPAMNITFEDDNENNKKKFLFVSLGIAGQLVTPRTPPKDIPSILLNLKSVTNKLEEKMPKDVTKEITDFLGGSKSKRKTIKRKTIRKGSKSKRKTIKRKTIKRKTIRKVR